MEPSYILSNAFSRIISLPGINSGMATMKTRSREFADELTMNLAGIALQPEARAMFNRYINDLWAKNAYVTRGFNYDEVVIGSGFHAAVYCANRVRAGFDKPLVLEAKETVGGAFAVSTIPSFRLNSANRPGVPGLPGENASLNYLPGAPIQADMLSGDEYSTNADMAFVIRATLAQYADVRTVIEVKEYRNPFDDDDDLVTLLCDTPSGVFEIFAKRVIDTRGIGTPDVPGADGVTVQTFPQFLASFDTAFPLKGLRKVAVIGDGDSARCAVEGLLGIGPSGRLAAAGLDYVNRIDWYAPGVPGRCKDYRKASRSRYWRIGAYLPRTFGETPNRLSVKNTRADAAIAGDKALVNGNVYDRAIICTGNKIPELYDINNPIRYWDSVNAGNVTIARSLGRIFAAGPTAQLPFTTREYEIGINRIPANQVSMFRYSSRTAALASMLKGV